MQTNLNLFWLVAVIAGILFVVGITLIKVGHWPRRRGTEPHCRRCDYPLTGCESTACPECGAMTEVHPVIHGMRHRRPAVAASGLVCVLLAAAPLGLAGYGWASGVNWYHHAPAWWVLREMQSASEPQANRGWQELKRRDQTGLLKPATQAAIVEFALSELPLTPPGPLREQTRTHLFDLARGGQLDPTQHDALVAIAMQRGMPGSGHAVEWEYFRLLSDAAAGGELNQSLDDQLIGATLAALVAGPASLSRNEAGWSRFLIERERAGRVQPDQFRDMVAVALDAQSWVEGRMYTYHMGWTDWLGHAYLADHLSEAEATRMRRQMARVTLAVRSVVREGEPTRYTTMLSGRTPNQAGFWSVIDRPHVTVNDEVISDGGHPVPIVGNFGGGHINAAGGGITVEMPVGRHEWVAVSRVKIYHGPPNDEQASRLLDSFEVTDHAVVEVLPADADDPVTPVRDPLLRDQMLAAFQPSRIERANAEMLLAYFNVPALPVAAAFDVVVVIEGKHHAVYHPLTTQQDEARTPYFFTEPGMPDVTHVDLILTPSAEAAKRTIGLFEYWDGEPLVIQNVPVQAQSSTP